jgi:Flp pilus assembly protein TadB
LDAISLIIVSSFGGFILLLILGFYLLQHRNRNGMEGPSPYGPRDYSQYRPRRPQQQQETRYSSYDSRRPYRTDDEIEANARRRQPNTRALMLAIMVLAIVAVIVVGLFNPLELILLIFLVPMAVSFLVRRNRNSNQESERDRRY